MRVLPTLLQACPVQEHLFSELGGRCPSVQSRRRMWWAGSSIDVGVFEVNGLTLFFLQLKIQPEGSPA